MEKDDFYGGLFEAGFVRCTSHFCFKKWYKPEEGYFPNPCFGFCSRECYESYCRKIGIDEKLLGNPLDSARG